MQKKNVNISQFVLYFRVVKSEVFMISDRLLPSEWGADLQAISVMQPGQHVYVDSTGHLAVYDKPTTIWARFCEWLFRIFNDPYPTLQTRLNDLTNSICGLIVHFKEQDRKQLNLFLERYTLPLNHLYITALKLQNLGRIQLPSFTFNPESPLTQWVLLAGKVSAIVLQIENRNDQSTLFSITNGKKEIFEQTIERKKSYNVILTGPLRQSWPITVEGKTTKISTRNAYTACQISLTSGSQVAFELQDWHAISCEEKEKGFSGSPTISWT